MNSRVGKETINTFSGGMNMDLDTSLIKPNQYRYAENYRVTPDSSGTFGALSPIEDEAIVIPNAFGGNEVLGAVSVRNISAVFARSDNATLIYRVTKNGETLTNKLICTLSYLSPDSVSSVLRYEDDDNIKLYWADGEHQIRVINIAPINDTYNAAITNADDLNVVPRSNTESPIIDAIMSGNLLAGRIQYYYQFYNKAGSASTLSPGSNIVNILHSDGSGGNISDLYGEPTGSAVRIKIKNPSNESLVGLKVYSVYYYNYGATPAISLIKDIDISSIEDDYIHIIDAGVSALSELTIEEFSLLSPPIFNAKYIETKNNILFAANINTGEFVVDDYDTRAFAFTKGQFETPPYEVPRVKVYSSDLSEDNAIDLSLSEFALRGIDPMHDAINKDIYSIEKYDDIEYKYDANGNLGGYGENVNYIFTNTYLIGAGVGKNAPASGIYLSPSSKYIDDRTPRIGSSEYQINNLLLKTSRNEDELVPLSELRASSHTGRLDYSNPVIAGAVTGYKRDEIYRFAAVFYDELGRKTEAKWIADIRFPSSYYLDEKWRANIFESPEEVAVAYSLSEINLDVQELLIKPLGLQFYFHNVPPSVKKIEIVRAKRDINNRTIYAQGVLQQVGTKKKLISDEAAATSKYTDNVGYDTLRPHPVVSMGYQYSVGPIISNPDASKFGFNDYSIEAYTNPALEHCAIAPYMSAMDSLLFISPEVSYNGIEFTEQLRHVVKNPIVSIQDIVFPKSTPVCTNVNSNYLNYIGNADHKKIIFDATYPSAIYFGADLSQQSIMNEAGSNKSFFSHGLFGASESFIESGSVADKYRITNSMVNSRLFGEDLLDIYIDKTPGVDVFETAHRGIVSLGGVGARDGVNMYYKHGVNGNTTSSSGSADFPPVLDLNGNNNKSNILGVTFKLYCTFNKKPNPSDLFGGDSIFIATHFGNEYMERFISSRSSIGELPISIVDEFEYSGDIATGISHHQSTDYISAGGRSYLNWSKRLPLDYSITESTITSTISRADASGRHGSALFMTFDSSSIVPRILSMSIKRKKYTSSAMYGDAFDQIEKNENLDKLGANSLSTFIVDLKKMSYGIYGGASRQDRQFTEYISTGAVVNVADGDDLKKINVFGGDSYISMFDYTAVYASDPMVENYPSFSTDDARRNSYDAVLLSQVKRVGIIVPIETSINTMAESGKSFVSNDSIFSINKEPGINSTAISAGGTYRMSQTKPEHSYNAAYSSESTAVGFTSDLFSSENNNDLDCRILSSEAKTNDELYDSWSIFKPNNYIDVDSSFGKITRLKTSADKLFFFQENAVGVVSVNDRALINDSNGSQLSLGTGGVLARYDYMSTNMGLSRDTIKGVIASDNGIYWYDKNRNAVQRISKGVETLSKSKGIQSIINTSKSSIGDKVPFGKNSKHNEVIMTTNGFITKEQFSFNTLETDEGLDIEINNDDLIIQ